MWRSDAGSLRFEGSLYLSGIFSVRISRTCKDLRIVPGIGRFIVFVLVL